jgi:hypothetical protein
MPAGRPRKQVDEQQVESLAGIGCTVVEMGQLCGVRLLPETEGAGRGGLYSSNSFLYFRSCLISAMTSKRIMANTFNALDDANVARNSFSVIGCAAGGAEGPGGSVTAVAFHINRLHLLRLMCVDSSTVADTLS